MTPQGIVFRNIFEADPESRGGAGGVGESARYDRGTPDARAPERGDNTENDCGDENTDDGPVGVLRGALTGDSETAGRAVD